MESSCRKMECTVFGGIVVDKNYEVDTWPQRGQDCFYRNEKEAVGGCALNMAVTARNLGAEVHVVSAVGEDASGDGIIRYLEDHHLSGRFVRRIPGRTGGCMIFTEPDGERTFISRIGAEDTFFPELMEKAEGGELAVIGVTGYYFLDPKTAGDALVFLEKCARQGSRILFDPSSLVSYIRTDDLQRLLAVCEICTPNETELTALGGKAFPEEAVRAGKTVIVKKGSRGGTVYTGSGTFDYAAEAAEAVDTTGAGDSFAGALLYAMLTDLPIKEAVRLGARCASYTVASREPHEFRSYSL